MDSLMQQIGVTPEQQKQLEDQRKEHMQEYQAIRNEVQEKERELRSALKDPDVDPAEIQRLKRELLQLQEKNINQKIEGTMRMREVLTEDQFNTLTDKIDARRKNRKGGRRR
jgi:Spy/CpxP family protein refolding chaperone